MKNCFVTRKKERKNVWNVYYYSRHIWFSNSIFNWHVNQIESFISEIMMEINSWLVRFRRTRRHRHTLNRTKSTRFWRYSMRLTELERQQQQRVQTNGKKTLSRIFSSFTRQIFGCVLLRYRPFLLCSISRFPFDRLYHHPAVINVGIRSHVYIEIARKRIEWGPTISTNVFCCYDISK